MIPSECKSLVWSSMVRPARYESADGHIKSAENFLRKRGEFAVKSVDDSKELFYGLNIFYSQL